MAEDKKMAVLIDAENVSDKYIKYIFEELPGYPYTITYKRIYGDWTGTRLSGWKGTLLQYSINPIQQYSYTTGKNASDSALIIDAMDILYTGQVDGFCIVSSDSDFTRLASRLRESGMYVLGMGEKKTPSAFITACEAFKYLEVISGDTAKTASIDKNDLDKIVKVIKKIVDEDSDEDGRIPLSIVGSQLLKKMPDFDVRNYGYSKLSSMLKSTKSFNVEFHRSKEAGSSPMVYILNK